jgi:hypothetical protein
MRPALSKVETRVMVAFLTTVKWNFYYFSFLSLSNMKILLLTWIIYLIHMLIKAIWQDP